MASNKDNGYQYRSKKCVIGDDELMTVYEVAQDIDRDVFKSRDLEDLCEFSTKQIGRRLSHLEDRELVERTTSQTPHTWRVK